MLQWEAKKKPPSKGNTNRLKTMLCYLDFEASIALKNASASSICLRNFGERITSSADTETLPLHENAILGDCLLGFGFEVVQKSELRKAIILYLLP
jgi:hypothetical protein